MKNYFQKRYHHQSWSKLFIYPILFIFIFIPFSLNLIIDPYYIFHTNIFKLELSVNERYNKIEYLNSNPSKYNSFLLGNSRIGTTNPHTIEKYIPYSKFYNMTLATANMEDIILHIQYLIKHNKSISNIYLQLDYLDMIFWGHIDENNFLYIQHPAVSHRNSAKFYIDYLRILPIETFKSKIQLNNSPNAVEHVHYDIDNTGMWVMNPKRENEIEVNPEKHVLNEPSFHVITMNIWKKEPIVYEKMLQSLRTIVALTKENHINLIIYTTPFNHALLNNFEISDMINYLEDISKIHNFYFFSDYNTITQDDTNYYESVHFRGKVGELIAAKIFNDKNIAVPNDFGIYITHDNFQHYKGPLIQNLKLYREKIIQDNLIKP